MRGTPQQIIDKYNQLARDAQLSGDRVAVENFQQHAEHYLRMLAEAQREQAERQAQQQQNQQNQQNNQQNNNPNAQNAPQNQNSPQNNQNQDRQNDQRGNQRRNERGDRNDRGGAPSPEQTSEIPAEVKAEAAVEAKSDDVLDVGATADAGLVETPENKPQKPKRTRKKAPVAEVEAAPAEVAPPDAAE